MRSAASIVRGAVLGAVVLSMCAAGAQAAMWEAVEDGGFEAGTYNPYWVESSMYFTSVISPGIGRGGSYGVMLGGVYGTEVASVRQQVELGNRGAVLTFWVKIGEASGNGIDEFRVLVDGALRFRITDADKPSYLEYTKVELNLSTFADGGTHQLRFEGRTYPTKNRGSWIDITVFYLDDVSLLTSSENLAADFTWEPSAPEVGDEVRFIDQSSGQPLEWHWTFGGSQNANVSDPTVVFSEPGDHSVKLTVIDESNFDTVTKDVTVYQRLRSDFSFTPAAPRAGEAVQFNNESSGLPDRWDWDFGDGGTSSEQAPQHTFAEPGSYDVKLEARRLLTGNSATTVKTVEVAEAYPEVDFQVSNSTPEIGEEVTFTVVGLKEITSLLWRFGDSNCDGLRQNVQCNSGDGADCRVRTYRFDTAGTKVVSLTSKDGGEVISTASHELVVADSGSCAANRAEADFAWWPSVPKVGQGVRFVDRSTGDPVTWQWAFGNLGSSDQRHPAFRFASAGVHEVSLTVADAAGAGTTATKSVTVEEPPVCGDGVCDDGETRWTCADDCGLRPGETGRAGRSSRRLFVPAAAGGAIGSNGTYWVTEGMVFNPGPDVVGCVLEFTPDDEPEEVRRAGPFYIQPERAVFFSNLVMQLFGSDQNGSIWLDADGPLIFDTRTFNLTDQGTFGQAIGAVAASDVLGSGGDRFYLVGLAENSRFRTNIILQEVLGFNVGVWMRLFDSDGSLIGEKLLQVPGHAKIQSRLRVLGFNNFDSAFATVRVVGNGKIVAIASKVDEITGDATTIDGVHPDRVLFSKRSPKVAAEDEHFLVAIVARVPGDLETFWRSELTVQNPSQQTQDLRLEYFPEGSTEPLTVQVQLPSNRVFHSDDLISNYFPEAGDSSGALHVYTADGAIIDSRTYNQLPDGGTMGQAIPGLGSGDMARVGETWVLNKIKSTNDFRCNIGFSEYAGEDTEVTVLLFDMGGNSRRFLASKTYEVSAFGNFQKGRIFEDMGLDEEYEEAMAYAVVTSQEGALYVYASVVDNLKGDATTVLAKRLE